MLAHLEHIAFVCSFGAIPDYTQALYSEITQVVLREPYDMWKI